MALGDLGVGKAAPQTLSLLRDASQGGRAQTTGSPGTDDRCSVKAGRNPWGESLELQGQSSRKAGWL